MESEMSVGEFNEGQKNIKELKGDKDVEVFERERILFMGFHKRSNAKVIAPNISEEEVKTFLSKDVREYFLGEDENMFREKEYLVNLEVIRRGGEIEAYHITDIVAS